MERRYQDYALNVLDMQAMTRVADTHRAHKHVNGVCHRCGWKAPVSKVNRVDRRTMGTGRAYGQLCDECVHHLMGTVETHGVEPRSITRRGHSHRVVA